MLIQKSVFHRRSLSRRRIEFYISVTKKGETFNFIWISTMTSACRNYRTALFLVALNTSEWKKNSTHIERFCEQHNHWHCAIERLCLCGVHVLVSLPLQTHILNQPTKCHRRKRNPNRNVISHLPLVVAVCLYKIVEILLLLPYRCVVVNASMLSFIDSGFTFSFSLTRTLPLFSLHYTLRIVQTLMTINSYAMRACVRACIHMLFVECGWKNDKEQNTSDSIFSCLSPSP